MSRTPHAHIRYIQTPTLNSAPTEQPEALNEAERALRAHKRTIKKRRARERGGVLWAYSPLAGGGGAGDAGEVGEAAGGHVAGGDDGEGEALEV